MKGPMAAELAEISACAPYAQRSSAFSFGGFFGYIMDKITVQK